MIQIRKYTYREIQDIMGISQRDISVILKKFKIKLAKRLSDIGYEDYNCVKDLLDDDVNNLESK